MRSSKRVKIIGIGILLFVASATTALLASSPDTQAQTTETKSEQARQAAEQKAATAQQRLTDAKLKACQNREKAITTIMNRIATRGQKQLDLFTTIADRTESFYARKGRTVATYDALVADLATKKSAAQATIDKIKSTSVSFACDGSDPKGMVDGFKESLKAEIAALKEYKTAVRNLIVAVKSAQGTASSSTNKATEENQ